MKIINICMLLMAMTAIADRRYIRIVDESGVPIPNVYVDAECNGYGAREWTDRNGVARLSFWIDYANKIHAVCIKPGYYPCNVEKVIDAPYASSTNTIVMQKMGTQFVDSLERWKENDKLSPFCGYLRINSEPCGFDLLEHDWMPPRGAGKVEDIRLWSQYTKPTEDTIEWRVFIDFVGTNTYGGIIDESYYSGCYTHYTRILGTSKLIRSINFTNHINLISRFPTYASYYEKVKRRWDAGLFESTYSDKTLPPSNIRCYEDDRAPITYLFLRIRTDSNGENGLFGYIPIFSIRPALETQSFCSFKTGDFKYNPMPGQDILETTFEYKDSLSFIEEYYRAPRFGGVSELAILPSATVNYTQNSLGMKISVPEIEGVRFSLYEVRNRDYNAFRPEHAKIDLPPGMGRKNRPVVAITPDDAREFCRWLTKKEQSAGLLSTNLAYRLPTAAEWVAAASTGNEALDNSDYPWGNLFPPRELPGNYLDRSAVSGQEGKEMPNDRYAYTAPVGSFRPNTHGLYDIYGNVWEMCSYSIEDLNETVCVGGSWRTWGQREMLKDSVLEVYNGDPALDVGFRIVLAPAIPENVSEDDEAEDEDDSEETSDAPENQPALPIQLNGFPAQGMSLLEDLGMVQIPAGSFTRCSEEMSWVDATELGESNAEGEVGVWLPAEMSISTNFMMGAKEVTQGLYSRVMGTNPCEQVQLDLPVDRVSFIDATQFCERLNTVAASLTNAIPSGWSFRLPTETEWEYAYHGATSTNMYAFKESDFVASTNMAWCAENSSGVLHPVGQLVPNAFGLYDMGGNVGEWCQDWYNGSYPIKSSTDESGPPWGNERVVRGGSASTPASRCSAISRTQAHPEARKSMLGFRIVLAPDRE